MPQVLVTLPLRVDGKTMLLVLDALRAQGAQHYERSELCVLDAVDHTVRSSIGVLQSANNALGALRCVRSWRPALTLTAQSSVLATRANDA